MDKRMHAQTGGDWTNFDDVAVAYMMAAENASTPDVKAWIDRYPQFAEQLADLASFTFMTQNATDDQSRTALSPRVRGALDAAFAPPVLAGLVARAAQLGHTAETLAADLHLSRDVVLMLDSRVVQPASIPSRLKSLLADRLRVGLAQVDAFFAMPAPRAVAAYKSSKAPAQQAQIAFADALRTSKMLSAEDKKYWEGD